MCAKNYANSALTVKSYKKRFFLPLSVEQGAFFKKGGALKIDKKMKMSS